MGYGSAQGSSLSLVLLGTVIDLKADNIPLVDLLKAISLKTGLTVRAGNPMVEPVSARCSEIPLESCLKQLLGNKNYVMVYKDQENGGSTLSELWLDFSENGGWFEKEFGDKGRLLGEISIKPITGDDPLERGIRVTGLASNSSFRKLGIQEGDLISNINGYPVQTGQDFVQALQSLSQDQPNLRIERRRSDNTIDPIYVDLRPPDKKKAP
jgi:hypothetical protein